MTPEQRINGFLKNKVSQWGPNPLAYVQRMGVEGLTTEFSHDPDLSQFCGWFNRPLDDQIVGGVEQFIQETNPVLGYGVTIIVQALIDACARRHELNKAAASENIKTGAGAVGIASLFIGLVMLLGGGGEN